MPKRLTTEEFIKKAQEVHGNKYDYSKVNYVNNKIPIKILCLKHGSFLQKPGDHLLKKGCLNCSVDNKRKSTEIFIKKVNKIHKNKYNYSKIDYVNNHTKIQIFCPAHGYFLQNPNSHLKGFGCPSCSLVKKLTTETFIEKSKKIHGNKYNYSKVNYINNYTKVLIICPKHGEFSQTPNSHLTGNGCPLCKSSKGELLIEKLLKHLNLLYIRQKTFNDLKNPLTGWKLRYDFYLPQENMLIEFNGIQHYKDTKYWNKNFKTQQFKDNIKQDYAFKNNYKLLIIKYNQNIEKKLKSNIHPF